MSVNLLIMIVIAITTVSINSVATSVFVTMAMLGMEQIAVSFFTPFILKMYHYLYILQICIKGPLNGILSD